MRTVLVNRIVPLAAVSSMLACANLVTERGDGSYSNAVMSGVLADDKGIVLVIGAPDPLQPFIAAASHSKGAFFFQLADQAEASAVRKSAEAAGLLGTRIFVVQGDAMLKGLSLADNLADAVVKVGGGSVAEAEVLRVLRPGGKAWFGDREVVKPAPAGLDPWRHPYHGPDNNPQSADRLARAPYLTQFVAEPQFGCMPEVTVAAGGRVFRAFGHIAFREYQNAAINTLMAVNAYNGTILWTRPLRDGFMIHRNTMIATADTLYLGDDQACRALDADTGKQRGQIIVPADISDGPVWKWMALHGGRIYALVGGSEISPPAQRGREQTLGGWPWGMWPGYDYKDPRTAWGFGRTFIAADPDAKRVVSLCREEEYIDSRGVCMHGDRIYYYSPGKFLACLNVQTGKVEWRTSDEHLLEAIGPNGRAQFYRTGFSTTAYLKANDKGLFFAGPQRPNLVAVSLDGKLLWQRKGGNFQLVLREDAIYAAGEQTGSPTSVKLDYVTGRELARFTDRRACTRATGSIDSIFYRAREGTVRMIPETGLTEHIASMRPPCNSGVVVSEGLLHWGPWICGYRLSMFGHVALGPAGKFDFHPKVDASRLQAGGGDITKVAPLAPAADDWPGHRPIYATTASVPAKVKMLWTYQPRTAGPASPASAVGDWVFVGGADGGVRGLSAADGKIRWQAFTAAHIRSAPTVADGRLYVGSADGWMYVIEATTGRRLWRFRVAPAQRWIPVLGRLQSTWPVAGGVAVADGVAYAAAGLTHYDGTYVVALDAVTGDVKWSNDSSGSLSKVHNGIELAGPLYVSGEKLCFDGGNVYATAEFNRRTGRCLNEPEDSESSSAYSLFHNPDARPGMVRMNLGGGQGIIADNNSGKLALGPAAAQPGSRPSGRAGPLCVYRAFVLVGDVLVMAGVAEQRMQSAGGETFAVAAMNTKDGSILWRVPLPAPPIPNGLIVVRGKIIVSLNDGRVVCLAEAE